MNIIWPLKFFLVFFFIFSFIRWVSRKSEGDLYSGISSLQQVDNKLSLGKEKEEDTKKKEMHYIIVLQLLSLFNGKLFLYMYAKYYCLCIDRS